MKQQITYLLTRGLIVFALDCIFGIVGLIGFVLPWKPVQIIFGLVIVVCVAGIMAIIGFTESGKGGLLNSKRKLNADAAELRTNAKQFAPWKGFAIAGIAIALQFVLLSIAIGVRGGYGRAIQVILGVIYSGFVSICKGAGFDFLTPDMLGYLWMFYFPLLITFLCFSIGYLVGGYYRRRLGRELEIEMNSYDV